MLPDEREGKRKNVNMESAAAVPMWYMYVRSRILELSCCYNQAQEKGVSFSKGV